MNANNASSDSYLSYNLFVISGNSEKKVALKQAFSIVFKACDVNISIVLILFHPRPFDWEVHLTPQFMKTLQIAYKNYKISCKKYIRE